jgi:hypothetical protein
MQSRAVEREHLACLEPLVKRLHSSHRRRELGVAVALAGEHIPNVVRVLSSPCRGGRGCRSTARWCWGFEHACFQEHGMPELVEAAGVAYAEVVRLAMGVIVVATAGFALRDWSHSARCL